MRIAICHPQTPFTRGGAEMHMEGLARALRDAGHDVDIVSIPFKWYPPTELVHQMASWRSVDLSEANGMPIDMVVTLKFPAYLVRHGRKVVWLIHQHRTAYELWDDPTYADLSVHEEGPVVREMIWRADRTALGEAKRIFTNSANVAGRLRRTLGLAADALYHRSPLSERLLEADPGDYGDYVLYPSRLEPLKRQSLVVEAMRHVRTPVRLILTGSGPQEGALRRQIDDEALAGRVSLEVAVPDERIVELYRGALGVYFGPFDEDYGYVTIEAMAARRPVITTSDSGGPLEFVRDGVDGYVVEPDPRAVARGLDRLYETRDRAPELGAAGHRVFLERVPEWPEIVARLLD